jgi:hypothetical protein
MQHIKTDIGEQINGEEVELDESITLVQKEEEEEEQNR